ncbi:MAG: hypothetical protein A2Y97_03885 [Nitrospirae bacterium RBG_13_39_12]|nr:MAG: hypothetical protein A2Y97_03885 [Nitrospirae bacterium RBG_13_39_12]
MIDFFAIVTIMFWPVIPLFWIPVHFATSFFRKIGFLTYIMPVITWLPCVYLTYHYKGFLLTLKINLPLVLNIFGIPLLIFGSLLHIWTARLLGIWGIIGLPEISTRVKENLVTGGPFSIVRHPTYSAHTLIFSGIFLITGSIAVGVITLLDFIVINSIIIPLEEKELLARFGEEYVTYKKKVSSRILPWIY